IQGIDPEAVADRGLRAAAISVAEAGADAAGTLLLLREVRVRGDDDLAAMTLARGEHAGGEHPDVHDTEIIAAAGFTDAAEVVPAPAWRRRPHGARIEHVAVDLGRIEATAVDNLDNRRRLAERTDADMLEETLLAQPVEGIGNPVRAEND